MPLKGVNLGGWLVLEKWITPSLFKDTTAHDEYTYCLQLNKASRKQLQQHRDTFIIEQDFKWLAEQGIEAVRLPVGYWLFGDATPYVETVKYVDRAFEWAARHGLKVLIDLHAAPGSQNGNDHSGRRGAITWHENQDNINQTLVALQKISARYGSNAALLGISLLNEPSHVLPQSVVEAFYVDAYTLIRQACPPDIWIVFSDSFRPKQWRHKLPPKQYPGLYIDNHHYQLFSGRDRRLSAWQQLLRTRYLVPIKFRIMTHYHPTIIGEWSLSLPNAAMGKLNHQQQSKIIRAYARAQLKAFRPTAAWFFWTYKTEAPGRWSFKACVETNLLPRE